jgi:hypothetical protein
VLLTAHAQALKAYHRPDLDIQKAQVDVSRLIVAVDKLTTRCESVSQTIAIVESLTPLGSRFCRYQGATDAHAGECGSGWRRFLCCGRLVRGLVSYVVFKRANGRLGTADREPPAQPGQDSKAAARPRPI